MANPQPDKFTKWSNELLEAIYCYPFTANELRVMLFIGRNTYGYGEKTINLRVSKIADGTNISNKIINRVLKGLISSSCILYQQVDGKIGVNIGIQKDYDKWKNRKKKNKSTIKLMVKHHQLDGKKGSSTNYIKEKRKGKKLTLAPDEFPITDQMRNYAARKNYNGDLKIMTKKFLKRHQAKGSKFKDWYKAWQTWLLNEMDFNPGKFSRSPPESNDPYNGDHFLKTANNLLTTQGYSENDFNRHCYGHGQDPRIVKQKLLKITQGGIA